ncbi:MAG: ankyrin repeat domain-containing protein [Pirellulaceae bacterium]
MRVVLKYAVAILVLLLVLAVSGGGMKYVYRVMPFTTWHAKQGWKAEKFFDDPQVIALCKAIEANDLEEIDRLIQAGADVNAKGKENMTPLLWSYPDNKLARFEKLLEHGADPNVKFEGRFGTDYFNPGDSVTHVAAQTKFDGYLAAVLKHGGDPNLTGWIGNLPLHLVISYAPNKRERIRLLLDAGADIDGLSGSDVTPVMWATSWGRQFSLALFLLENGADPTVRQEISLQNYVEILVSNEIQTKKYWSPQQQTDFQKLEKWLVAQGISVNDARDDLKRWQEWGRTHTYKHHRDTLGYRERAERKAKEQADKDLMP